MPTHFRYLPSATTWQLFSLPPRACCLFIAALAPSPSTFHTCTAFLHRRAAAVTPGGTSICVTYNAIRRVIHVKYSWRLTYYLANLPACLLHAVKHLHAAGHHHHLTPTPLFAHTPATMALPHAAFTLPPPVAGEQTDQASAPMHPLCAICPSSAARLSMPPYLRIREAARCITRRKAYLYQTGGEEKLAGRRLKKAYHCTAP